MSGSERQSVAEHFSDKSRDWVDRYRTSPSFAARLEVVGGAVRDETEARVAPLVLDFGGGPGIFSAVASACSPLVVCLDPSLEMLDAGKARPQALERLVAITGARCRLERIHRVAGTIDVVSDRQRFDVILAIGVLEYLPRPDDVLQRLIELLAPTGTLLFTVPNPRSPLRIIEGVFNQVAAIASKAIDSKKLRDRAYGALRPHGSRTPWQRAVESSDARIKKVPLSAGLARFSHPNLLIRVQKS